MSADSIGGYPPVPRASRSPGSRAHPSRSSRASHSPGTRAHLSSRKLRQDTRPRRPPSAGSLLHSRPRKDPKISRSHNKTNLLNNKRRQRNRQNLPQHPRPRQRLSPTSPNPTNQAPIPLTPLLAASSQPSSQPSPSRRESYRVRRFHRRIPPVPRRRLKAPRPVPTTTALKKKEKQKKSGNKERLIQKL